MVEVIWLLSAVLLTGGGCAGTYSVLLPSESQFEAKYTASQTGCEVNGREFSLYERFTVDVLDSCVQFVCTKDMVMVLQQMSGCFDGATCRRNLFSDGCNNYHCKVNGTTKTSTNTVTVHKSLTITDQERCKIYSQPGCYDLKMWHYFKGRRCYCEAFNRVKCIKLEPDFIGPAVMNYVN